jgi:hypothetical protein
MAEQTQPKRPYESGYERNRRRATEKGANQPPKPKKPASDPSVPKGPFSIGQGYLNRNRRPASAPTPKAPTSPAPDLSLSGRGGGGNKGRAGSNTPPSGAMAAALSAAEVAQAAAPAQAAIAASRPAQIQRANGAMANLTDVNQERRQRAVYGREPRPGDAPISDAQMRQRGAPNTRWNPSEQGLLDSVAGGQGALTREAGIGNGGVFKHVSQDGRTSYSDNVDDAMRANGASRAAGSEAAQLQQLYKQNAQQRAKDYGLDPRMEQLQAPAISRGEYNDNRRMRGDVERQRALETAREGALLKAGFLPQGMETQATRADQRADRQQQFLEQTDQRDHGYQAGRHAVDDRFRQQELDQQGRLQDQQIKTSESERAFNDARLEAEVQRMQLADPWLKPLPTWDSVAAAKHDPVHQEYARSMFDEDSIAARMAYAKYASLLKKTGAADLAELWPQLTKEDADVLGPIIGDGFYRHMSGQRNYAEGGPVYGAPPDAASAESALGRYRDYMVQAQHMGLPTIPFEQFAQIQASAGPVQRYAMGGALQAHRKNAERMSDSGMLVNKQDLQQQSLNLEARGQNIEADKNAASAALTRRGQTMDANTDLLRMGARNPEAFRPGMLSTNTLESKYSMAPALTGAAATDVDSNYLDDFSKLFDKSSLDFARGGPVPGAMEQAQQGQSPKFVMDADPNAPVDSIPAVIDDEQPARLNSGEFVIPTDVVQFYGLDKLNKMIAAARKGQEMQGA